MQKLTTIFGLMVNGCFVILAGVITQHPEVPDLDAVKQAAMALYCFLLFSSILGHLICLIFEE